MTCIMEAFKMAKVPQGQLFIVLLYPSPTLPLSQPVSWECPMGTWSSQSLQSLPITEAECSLTPEGFGKGVLLGGGPS